MSLSTDDIITKFPVKNFPPIGGEPTYESIMEIMKVLYRNAAALPTTLGGGLNGHHGIIMSPSRASHTLHWKIEDYPPFTLQATSH